MSSGEYFSRRTFLQALGASVPTLSLIGSDVGRSQPGRGTSTSLQATSSRFTPVDLGVHFTASPVDFGPRERARRLRGDSARDGLVRMPGGSQTFRGIPFLLGPTGLEEKAWVGVSTLVRPWTRRTVRIPFRGEAGFICLAQFCDWDDNETPERGQQQAERVGQHLADLVIEYAEGEPEGRPIRRRFEVNSPSIFWGHSCFAARPHREMVATALGDPLRRGTDWGGLQTGIRRETSDDPQGQLWICALDNPFPDRTVTALEFRAASDDPLMLCGLSVFHGRENPLRYQRLTLYRLTLPAPGFGDRWEVDIDLGVVARTCVPSAFDPDDWLVAADRGLGRDDEPGEGHYLYVEAVASPEATLRLHDNRTSMTYHFDLALAVSGRELEPRTGVGARIELLEPDKVWLHGTVQDVDTGRPTPARLAFRSAEGRYIPPYGHRADINASWFQDYGADLKLRDSSFAYVDGVFQVELPVGAIYVEVTKGFEYQAIRRRLEIEPGQRELKLEIPRLAGMREEGWVSADVHVHFLSPTTAILEGQAEGVNLINLLAAQWGDLFSNVGDLSQGSVRSADGETMVRLGTENRQHILGHLGLLGGHGEPVQPLSAGGPPESQLGDPLWNSLAEWADACRRRDGVSVAMHFPYPTGELPADIALGKIDAVELYPYGSYFNSLPYLDWYRYLNCGFRLAAVGGTDKMGAYVAVGANRTYAYLGDEEFTFANWANAVRKGRTFQTTGPLLLMQVEGRRPGAEIRLGRGGGTVGVQVDVRSFLPFHRLEIVLNGEVVAAREAAEGVSRMRLTERIHVAGPGWLAARCVSRVGETVEWPTEIAGRDPPAIAAHTSPVYLVMPGRELFSGPAATYMLTLIDGAQTYVEKLATRPDGERIERTRTVLEDARAHLHRQLHRHGIPH